MSTAAQINANQGLYTFTNPENGTLAYKTDAKGQKVEYTYDSLKRVTQTTRKPNGPAADTCQQTNYYYDTKPKQAGM